MSKEQAIEKGQAAQDTAGEAQEFKDGATGVGGEVASFMDTPVAGPAPIKILYYVIMLFVVVTFVYALVGVAPGWAEPVTTLEVIAVPSLAFPDVFHCFPGSWIHAINTGEFGPDGGAGRFLKQTFDHDCAGLQQAASIAEAGNPDLAKCFVKDLTASGDVSTFTTELFSDAPNRQKPYSAKKSSRAEALAKKIPPYKGSDGQEYEGFCIEYNAEGAEVDMSDTTLKFYVWSMEPDMKESNLEAGANMFSMLYLVPPGADVEDAQGHFLPFFGMMVQVEMSVTMVLDEIIGMTDWVPRYSVTTTPTPSQITNQWRNEDGTVETDTTFTHVGIFKFASFVVNHVHRRRKYYGEMWAEIGGAWGASALLMTLFFTASGFVRASDQKELMVFRWQSAGMKKAAIKGAKGQVKETEVEALQRKVADLEKRLGSSQV